MHRLLASLVVVMTASAAACGDDGRARPGVDVTLVAEGFDGPTQIALAPDGRLLVAELNGGERDGTGRVVAVDPDDPSARDVLADGLLTPTGVAVEDGRLWIMEQRRITVGALDDPADRRIVLDDLPYNGRSEGTLTVLSEGRILYDTSGRRDGDRLAPGSGTLWVLDGPDGTPQPYATGLKHAYAHTLGPDGRLWATEISDGRLDGREPPDELVEVEPGDDFGYPRCVGDRTPVAELGAADTDCAATPPSQALFDPGATPTSVAVAPWDDDLLLIALWNEGRIVAVPTTAAGRPHEPVEVLTGLLAGVARPQHLLVDGARLLVVDHDAGRVLAVTASPDGWIRALDP